MNPEYPPFLCPKPEFFERAPLKSFPPVVQALEKRGEIVAKLIPQVSRLSQERKKMSLEERRAVFYKLQHTRPITTSGTGIRIVCTSPNYSLAIVDDNEKDLQKLEQKIRAFGETNKKVENYSLVAPLQNIEIGNPKDRLSESLFEQYNSLIVSKDLIILEIEIMVPERDDSFSESSLQTVRQEIAARIRISGGAMFEHEELHNTCRAVIRCNGETFKELVEDKKWQRKIWWFEPKPEFETFHSIIHQFDFSKLKPPVAPSTNAPVVCVVDSGVMPGNPFLAPVCKTDKEFFKSFLKKNNNPYDEYGHGSGVASLVSYYALNIADDALNIGKVWIASARILDDNNRCEDETLFSKVLENVVKHFVPLGVKIFNLSVCIINRYWNKEQKRTVPRKSWIARKIDYLSRKYDVVFVICTGNIPTGEVSDNLNSGINYPEYFQKEESTLLDPSQSALALSVGSLAGITKIVGRSDDFSVLAQYRFPAPFTRRGSGVNDEIKPEVTIDSGNYVLNTSLNNVTTNPGTDVFVASHQLTPALVHNTGTSFSAPRVAHHLALILQDLQQLQITPSSALLKAFLVNSTVIPKEIETFNKALEECIIDKQQTKFVSEMLTGYGIPATERATYCDDYSVIFYFDGQIEQDKVALFKIPIPSALKGTKRTETKRITITTCHLPEVQRWGVENYIGTTIKWRLFRGDGDQQAILQKMRKDEDESEDEVNDNANDREIKFSYGIKKRSKGCIQHDYCTWKQHRKNYSQNDYILAITAYDKWHRKQEPVRLAIVVRIEEESRKIQIYSEIKNIIKQQAQIQK
jgi:hypothetical protein